MERGGQCASEPGRNDHEAVRGSPHMAPEQTTPLLAQTRRQFFRDCAVGLGTAALASMLPSTALAEPARTDPLAPRPPHYPAKAKAVIYLFMNGAPSQLDLFEPKPKLIEFDRKECPAEYLKGERFAFIKGVPKLLA